MLNLFKDFKDIFFKSLQKLAQENNIIINQDDFDNFTVEPTKDNKNGDLACNIAMVVFKKFAKNFKNPRLLADAIINNINNDNILKIEIAGPGFINIFCHNKIFHQLLFDLISKPNFEFANLGKGQKINLEYASPNPTGPIHVGHTRGAIYGDVLAKLLSKLGWDVLKEYYINDAGSQITTLLKSAYLRYLEACGQEITIPDGLYPGDYLIEIGQKLKNKFGESLIKQDETQNLSQIRDFVVNSMVEIIKNDLLDLGIKHDSYFFEKTNLHDSNKISQTIDILKNKGLIYEGKLEKPKTQKGVGLLESKYDNSIQTLFASTKFGDDQDRVVKKSDGSFTYFAGDIAYSASKFERGATTFIMPLGFDHAGYVKRLNAAVKALTNDQAKLKVILCQMVKFIKNGQPLKMSKRAGNFITARQVIDEVGSDALRFIMLTRKNDAPFDFDLDKVIEQSKDNPIFYVQYAHARCCSVIRNLAAENITLPQVIEENILQNLSDESELNLIKKIATFPRILENAAINFEPHRLAFYLQELAAEFHALWHKGSEDKSLKFIIPNNLELTFSRVYLILAVKKIIANGLDIFNIKALEEMK